MVHVILKAAPNESRERTCLQQALSNLGLQKANKNSEFPSPKAREFLGSWKKSLNRQQRINSTPHEFAFRKTKVPWPKLDINGQ